MRFGNGQSNGRRGSLNIGRVRRLQGTKNNTAKLIPEAIYFFHVGRGSKACCERKELYLFVLLF